MDKKIYYNLTRIKNGWLLNYPTYNAGTSLQSGTNESYHKTLTDAISSIHKHFQERDLEYSEPWISPVGGEDAFIINLPNGKKIKVDGILENVKEVK